MTEPRTYPYLKYFPHFVILRLIVLGPFAIAQATAEFISDSLDKVCHKIDKFLPSPYVEKRVEWDQLPNMNKNMIPMKFLERDYHRFAKSLRPKVSIDDSGSTTVNMLEALLSREGKEALSDMESRSD